MKIIVLGYSTYSFVDEKTGEVREGGSLWYYFPSESGAPIIPIKQAIRLDFANRLKSHSYPFSAEAKYEMKSGAQNKLVLNVTDVIPD